MNMINIVMAVFISLFLSACSSTKEKPTRDICSIEKHFKDNIFRVKINGQAINEQWYLHQDAWDITRQLAKRNKCMP